MRQLRKACARRKIHYCCGDEAFYGHARLFTDRRSSLLGTCGAYEGQSMGVRRRFSGIPRRFRHNRLSTKEVAALRGLREKWIVPFFFTDGGERSVTRAKDRILGQG